MIDSAVIKSEEKLIFELRSLYRRYGYLPYEMSKFEEYELYARNKDFLVSDRIITFNDTDGRLLALKPDVTLSVIKNGEDIPNFKQKVYYNENVYRVSGGTCGFKEIMQVGLECIGDIDLYDVYETVTLAAQSLSSISEEFVLEVSHSGILGDALENVCDDETFAKEAHGFIVAKNVHDLTRLCERYGVGKKADMLIPFITESGDRKKVLAALTKIYGAEKLCELKALSDLLDGSKYGEHIRFDFSVASNAQYYNGFVFCGFIGGGNESVLAGGRYDKMMKRMKRSSGAIGFAIYLDKIGGKTDGEDYDADVLVLYDENTDSRKVIEAVRRLTSEGKTVSAQKSLCGKLRCRQTLDIREGVKC